MRNVTSCYEEITLCAYNDNYTAAKMSNIWLWFDIYLLHCCLENIRTKRKKNTYFLNQYFCYFKIYFYNMGGKKSFFIKR